MYLFFINRNITSQDFTQNTFEPKLQDQLSVKPPSSIHITDLIPSNWEPGIVYFFRDMEVNQTDIQSYLEGKVIEIGYNYYLIDEVQKTKVLTNNDTKYFKLIPNTNTKDGITRKIDTNRVEIKPGDYVFMNGINFINDAYVANWVTKKN